MKLVLRFTFLLLLAGFSLQAQEEKPILGTATLVETEKEAESVFRDNIPKHGLFAVILSVINNTQDRTFTFQRANILVQTEFDLKIPSLAAGRTGAWIYTWGKRARDLQ